MQTVDAKELFRRAVSKLMQEGVDPQDARTLAKAAALVDGEVVISANTHTTPIAQEYGLAQVGDKFYLD